jgi:hypothetical protein
MPCACQIPVPKYPETADWGPLLWTILHALAERAGTSPNPADEIREWQKLIKLTGEMLPCEHCRAHFARWLAQNPVSALSTIPSNTVRQWIRMWFFNLHNEVNIENGKAVFPLDQLSATYGRVNFQDLLWRLDPVIQKAISLNGVSLFKWTNWTKSFRMLRSLLGLA